MASGNPVTLNTCKLAGAWNFRASDAPAVPLSTGVFTAQYNGGNYLASPDPSSSTLTTLPNMDPTRCYFYMSNFKDSTGQVFSALFPAQTIDPSGAGTLSYVSDTPCNAPTLQLQSSSMDPPLQVSGVVLGHQPNDPTKQCLYSAACDMRFVPDPAPITRWKTIVPSNDPSEAYLWTFTQIQFPVPTTGLVPQHNTFFLQWSLSGTSSLFLNNAKVPFLGLSPTYDFNATQLTYVNNNLVIGCGGGGTLLFDPTSAWYASVGTSTGGQTIATVTLTTSEIYVDGGGTFSGFQVLPFNSSSKGQCAIVVPPIFTLATSGKAWTYQLTNLVTSEVTSLGAGNYVIQYGQDRKWCLQPDGSLAVCGDASPQWTYNPTTFQLSNGANYLMNPNPSISLCSPFQPFSVTTDGSNSGTKRFMLTTTNQFLDTATGLCYTSLVESKMAETMMLGASSISKKTEIELIIGGLVLIGFIVLGLAWLKQKKKRGA